MIYAATLAAALLAAQPAAAVICTNIHDPRPVEEQQDDLARSNYPRAEAMVEVVVVRSSTAARPGVMRVVRAFKGPVRPGRLLTLQSGGKCGAGDFKRGDRGLILIGRLNGRNMFRGWLPGDFLQRLDRLGLRPIGAPAGR